MKKLSILLCVLMTLAMLSVTVAHVWAAEEEATPPKADAKSDSGGGGDKKKNTDVTGGRFVGDPIYVHLDPMVMPIITDSGVEQLITMQIDVEVSDFETADQLHIQMPKVMDALMRALYGGLGQGSLRRGKLVDVTKVKAKAVEALGSVVGPEHVKDVLIQGVAQRML